MSIFKAYLDNRVKLLSYKDNTTRFMKNTLKNLKYVKMMTWENFCFQRIGSLRALELKAMAKSYGLLTVYIFISLAGGPVS